MVSSFPRWCTFICIKLLCWFGLFSLQPSLLPLLSPCPLSGIVLLHSWINLRLKRVEILNYEEYEGIFLPVCKHLSHLMVFEIFFEL